MSNNNGNIHHMLLNIRKRIYNAIILFINLPAVLTLK